VIYTLNDDKTLISESTKNIIVSFKPFFFSLSKLCIYCATTDNTSSFILLNSSKQHHAPLELNPLKKVPIMVYSISGPQLNTLHSLAKFLARSLVVSVLPVPAGPDGDPPKLSLIAPINVI
jgi:hypothetical protein